MPNASSLSKFPKPNYLRLRIAVHRKKHSREVAASYVDAWQISHRTPWCRNRAQAEQTLRSHFTRALGIGRVSFVIVEETIE